MICHFVPPMCPEGQQLQHERCLGRSGPVMRAMTARKSIPAVGNRKKKVFRGSTKPISILLIEDNRLFRVGLSTLLKRQDGLRLLASSDKPERALLPGRGQRPDVILLDLGLGGRGSLQVVRDLRAMYPETKLIMMGLVPMESEVLGLVKEGVSGFVLKNASISDFVASIRAVAAGETVFPSVLTESLLSQIAEDAARKGAVNAADLALTRREREIVDLIADGLSNKEIGKRLNIATDTVKSHVHNILEKLALRSRVEVAVRARVRAPAVN